MDHKQLVIISWLAQVQSIVTKGKFCRFNYQPSSLKLCILEGIFTQVWIKVGELMCQLRATQISIYYICVQVKQLETDNQYLTFYIRYERFGKSRSTNRLSMKVYNHTAYIHRWDVNTAKWLYKPSSFYIIWQWVMDFSEQQAACK